MMYRKILSQESGFSLIEVVMASGLAVTLSLAIAYQNNLLGTLSRRTDATFEINEIRSMIETSMKNPAACRATFGGLIPNVVTSVQRIYRMQRLPASSVWVTQTAYQVESPMNILTPVRIAGIDMTGALMPRSNGRVMAHVRFRVPLSEGRSTEVARDIPIFAVTDQGGQVSDCQTFEAGGVLQGSTPMLCADQVADCADQGDYCKGQAYNSTVENCLCFGTKVTGPNPAGRECSLTVSPSPTPTPTSTPTPPPSGTPSPSPSSIPGTAVLESGFLSNGTNSIDFGFKLKMTGLVRYAIFDTDQGNLSPFDVKMYAAMTPTGALRAAGNSPSVGAGVATTVSAPALPDKVHYFAYYVAENSSSQLDTSTKAYKNVIPRKLSMQQIPVAWVPGGRNVFYMVSFPPNYYDSVAPMPLAVWFHGKGEVFSDSANEESYFTTGPTNMYKTIPGSAGRMDQMPMVSIAIQCNMMYFDCTNFSDGNFASWSVKVADLLYHIDDKRRYAIGWSFGGNGAWHAIATHGDLFAAAVPFSTTNIWVGYKPSLCANGAANGVAILGVHNSDDLLVGVNGTINAVNLYNSCPTLPRPAIKQILPGNVWPAWTQAGYTAAAVDSYHHDAITYSMVLPFWSYPNNAVYETPAMEPNIAAFLASESVKYGKPVNTIWDWMLLFSKP